MLKTLPLVLQIKSTARRGRARQVEVSVPQVLARTLMPIAIQTVPALFNDETQRPDSTGVYADDSCGFERLGYGSEYDPVY